MLGSLSGAFLLKSHHYLKVKENLLCCLSGRQFKVNQHEWKKKKKKANLLCNKSHICLFLLYWGSIMCWMPAENCNSLHQTSPSPIMHLWGMAKPLLRPGCLTRSQQQLQLRRSHRSQTHAHSDAAGFSVINKKWRHEVLAGWLAEPWWRSASKSSASGLMLVLFFISVFLLNISGGGKVFLWHWQQFAG